MKIDKIIYKNNQAWISINNDKGEFIGIFNVINKGFIEFLKQHDPKEIEFTDLLEVTEEDVK